MAGITTKLIKCAARSYAFRRKTSLFINFNNSSSMKLQNSYSMLRCLCTTSFLQAERRFTDKHEWVEVNKNIGTVGISDYAQDALGDVVYAQLPDVGTSVKKEEECGALESVKAASEIMSPVSGKIVEKNESVESKPGLINSSCYNEGWLFKIELSDADEVNTLMDEKSYNEFLKSNPH